jgi:hypothetical protein
LQPCQSSMPLINNRHARSSPENAIDDQIDF